ncbi:hypothetical protein, partial [Anoxybacteroides tepidamans]|uniref:hypothetical protein n=1 Tax=Anoxybacteroides tepidamans TaxID=265948 RepID=UPI0004836C5F
LHHAAHSLDNNFAQYQVIFPCFFLVYMLVFSSKNSPNNMELYFNGHHCGIKNIAIAIQNLKNRRQKITPPFYHDMSQEK